MNSKNTSDKNKAQALNKTVVSSSLFLRELGLNWSFKLKGADFDGNLLELLKKYDEFKNK